ncbi:MAG: extracellular solute-binding protein [Ardenticatenales bacterium]|nr:extracellular solute-binding protein [Ardenticatenales bacterium]
MVGLVQEGLIVPFDDFTSAEEDGRAYLNDFLPAFLENSYYNDNLWGIPFQRSAVVLYYNADRLAEAGLEPPTSWAAWGEVDQTLTVKAGLALSAAGDWQRPEYR